MGTVLVGLESPTLTQTVYEALTDRGYGVVVAHTIEKARHHRTYDRAQAVVTSLQMPAIGALFGDNPRPPVITIDEAAPLDLQMLFDELALALAQPRARTAQPDQAPALERLLGASDVLENIRAQLRIIAPTEAPVLIVGETGTGKELAAQALHQLSRRAAKPLVAVNCAALPEQLLESELFGHAQGSFTGATAQKRGLFEENHKGTVFLDEINSLSPIIQAKLLRFIQFGEGRRVGSNTPYTVNVRILAATNQDLTVLLAAKTFREDLYYRLAAFEIELPPVRVRGDDGVLLARQFAGARALTPELEWFIGAYRWPGNVRELQFAIEHAAAMARPGRLLAVEHLPARLRAAAAQLPGAAKADPAPRLVPAAPTAKQWPPLAAWESIQRAHYIRAALAHCQGSRRQTARLLGVSVATLYRRLPGGAIDTPAAAVCAAPPRS